MRTFTYRTLAAAAAMEIGDGGRGDIHKLTAASVMYAADAVHTVLDKAVQIHGGSGYIWESEINRLFRSTKLLEIGAGTTEVRKMIIAGELLKDMRAMSEAGQTFGLDDDALATRSDRLRAGRLCRTRSSLVSGGAGGIGRGDRLVARAARRACRRRRPQRRRSSTPLVEAMAARGLKASRRRRRYPRARAGRRAVRARLGEARRARPARQQRRRPVSASRDRFFRRRAGTPSSTPISTAPGI